MPMGRSYGCECADRTDDSLRVRSDWNQTSRGIHIRPQPACLARSLCYRPYPLEADFAVR
jgi:hypothetical protein